MAKQRGIHQIKGKINNLCYYEQKYVRGGLIRRINEAMSERLKTDPKFVRTRYANSIFGGCSMYSGVLLSFFGSRNTFLFKPYRHALLTKAVQRYLLTFEAGYEYPLIGSSGSLFHKFSQVVNGIVKNSIFDSFVELERHRFDLVLGDSVDFIFYRDSLESFCKRYHCIGVQLSVSAPKYIYSSSYSSELKSYNTPDNNAGGRALYLNWYLNQDDDHAVLSSSTGDVDDTFTFWIVYAHPILSTQGDRPITGQTGACCGIVTFIAM